MGLELRVVISANINSTIAVIFKKTSLRPSEAEIRIPPNRGHAQKRAWSFRGHYRQYKLCNQAQSIVMVY